MAIVFNFVTRDHVLIRAKGHGREKKNGKDKSERNFMEGVQKVAVCYSATCAPLLQWCLELRNTLKCSSLRFV